MRVIRMVCALTIGAAVIMPSGIFAAAAEASLSGRRVGVFCDTNFPGGPRDGEWYRSTLQDKGCEVKLLDAEELGRPDLLSRQKLDVLILPDGQRIPYEAAYAIPNFLAEGGSVIAGRLPEAGMKKNPQDGAWKSAVTLSWPNNATFMQQNLMNDFQIRHLGGPAAQRSLATNLAVNPKLADDIKAGLPATFGPLARKYQLLNKIWFKEYEGATNDDNVETAANIIFPVYLLPSGEATDFIVYRYHNTYFNGSSLVLLGETGRALLAGERGADVIAACLQFCAMKLPGEQGTPFYERLVALNRQVSEYGRVFSDAFPVLRDAAMAAFYRQDPKAYARIRQYLADAEKSLTEIVAEKQDLDKQLLANSNPQDQDRRRQALLKRIAGEQERLESFRKEVMPELKNVNYPEKVKIQSALGTLPVEAGYSWCGLYALRKDFFPTMKALGVNAWYLYGGYFFYPYLDDPAVKAAMEGLKLDVAFGCGGGPRAGGGWHNLGNIMPGQGRLDLATGKIEETARQTYDQAAFEQALREFLRCWQSFPLLRVYFTTAESGLRNRFWGEQAREEYLAHLQAKYGGIDKLNVRWGTNFKDYAGIELPTARPVTAVEHAQWEDWTKFREKRIFAARMLAYNLFKKQAPDIPCSMCISTESINSQAYSGIDIYQLSKTQDLFGPDGTTSGVAQEWKFLDLNCGLPVFSVEWGLFYFAPADMLRSRKALTRQLWWEVSGGHIGINLWYFRWPGFKANYVDSTGLPTLLGWELKQILADFRKIEPVLLDGKRPSPSTLILFSNTSRVHDQGWGLKGEASSSKHLTAVNQLYLSMCHQHEPARVIDEGAILDGADLSACRLLIVSQAHYLSDEIQKALQAYVENGGTLFLDGMSGQFDNYGNAGRSLFKKILVVPSAIKNGAVTLADGRTYKPSANTVFYSPQALITNSHQVLLKYKSGEPAIIEQQHGKGRLIVSGISINAAGKDTKASLMQMISRQAGIKPAYICSDESLLIREWDYAGGRYLVCAYPEGKDLLSTFQLKILGNYIVRDYMLGIDLSVNYDGKYTILQGTITSPGGRVYQLLPGKASSGQAVKTGADEIPDAPRSTAKPDKAELPYSGKIFEADEQVRIGEYTFQAVLVPDWTAPDKGKSWLTVSRGDTSRKQELEVGKETRFVFHDEIICVRFISGFYMYPPHVTVEITKEPRSPLVSNCRIKRDGNDLLLSNGMLSFRILPDQGGRITEGLLLPEGINQVYGLGIKENEGKAPGVWMEQQFKAEVLADTPSEIKVRMQTVQNVANMSLSKEMTLKQDEARATWLLQERNCAETPAQMALHLHPELRIGGTADDQDVFFVPGKDGVRQIQYVVSQSRSLAPAEGWSACCDQRAKTAYICAFPVEQVKTVYFWFGSDSYTFELWTPRMEIPAGGVLPLSVDFYWLKDITGVDAFRDGWAAYLTFPDGGPGPDQKMNYRLELASARLQAVPVRIKTTLCQAGKAVREINAADGNVGYENALAEDYSFATDGLADGEYELKVMVADKDGRDLLAVQKKLTIAQSTRQADEKLFSDLKKRLGILRQKPSIDREALFDAYALFEDLGADIAQGNQEEVGRKRSDLERKLESFEQR